MKNKDCQEIQKINDCDTNFNDMEMNSWRENECSSPADTYIEWCFEQKCKMLKDGYEILTEWRTRKRYYVRILETVSLDFQHFSRHDDTHSINILEAIEMLLGKARINMLSAGDLWLILECAYAHDTGMAMSDGELRRLWTDDPEFRNYLRRALEQHDHPNHDAAKSYRVLDTLLKKSPDTEETKIKNIEEMFPKEWPVNFSRSISLLMSDYIRSKHAERVWEAWNRKDKNTDPVIPRRLDRAVQIASQLHGKDFKRIASDLDYCCKGFGNGRIHPRFAAAMLRIGDMLDLDNNRFNPRTIEHFGVLPYVSMLHYKKHQAITHLAIKESRIDVKAISDDIDVCKVLSDWFEGLKEETNDLICNWNDIVPEKLKGCLLKPCKCEILYEPQAGERKEFQSRPEKEFQVDKNKLINLLGSSIYASDMDFVREYLQNALDATKMQFWKDYKNGKFKYDRNMNKNVLEAELSPFDFGEELYRKYEIRLEIFLDFSTQKVRLSFIDCGIGMEQECVDVLAKVGTGWRGRKGYSSSINEMPKWLRPTGGFGIGIQSAFMVTDNVTIITRDKDSSIGRRIILNNPKQRGTVTEEGSVNCERGTIIEVELDLSHFYDSARIYEMFAKSEKDNGQNRGYKRLAEIDLPKDPFNHGQVKRYIIDFLKEYIEVMIPDALFPIRIVYPQKEGDLCKIIDNQFFPHWNYWEDKTAVPPKYNFLQKHRRVEENGEKYHFFFQKKDEISVMQALVWDIQRNISYIFFIGNYEMEEMRVCFKNVLVKEEITSDYQWLGRYGLLVDYMGFQAKEILKVHRDKFDDRFRTERQPDYIKKAYWILFHELERLRKDTCDPIGGIIAPYLDSLDAIMLRLIYLREKIDRISADKIGNVILPDGILLQSLIPWKLGEVSTCQQLVDGIRNFIQSEDGSIIIQSEEALSRNNEYSINTQNMDKWEELQNSNPDEIKKALADNSTFKFLNDLKKCEKVIIIGKYADVLFKLPQVDKVGFCFDNNKKEHYIRLTKNHEKYADNIENTFWLAYHKASEKNQRFIAEKMRDDFFPEIQVHVLPFSKAPATEHGMIISPIGWNAYDEINRRMQVSEQKVLNYEMFLECIVSQDEYKLLVKYVYDQQNKHEGHVGQQEIDAEYRKYIRKIYEQYIVEKENGIKKMTH